MIRYSRVEGLARALARAAGSDPDEWVGGYAECALPLSAQPYPSGIPAWQRFRLAAEDACVRHDVLSEPPSEGVSHSVAALPPPTSRDVPKGPDVPNLRG